MNKHTQQRLFEILYALVAQDGREAALFGESAPFAFEAFARSMASEEFPEVWFEIPLAGEPWFDLHLPTERDALNSNMAFSSSDTGGHPDVFKWYARQEGVRQLILSWDVSKGIDAPAVHVLATKQDRELFCSFLRAAGRGDLQEAYCRFVERIPDLWFPCYIGVFPNREHDFVRVECVPDKLLQRSYAQDASLLEAHLRQAGINEFGETTVPRCQALARTPFQIEFQFDVMPDGATGPMFSASARFACPPGEGDWQPFDPEGAAGELMQEIQAWGLSDERWQLLADTIFAKRVTWDGGSCLLFNYPAFVKLRWRHGEPLDAKSYLLAGAQDALAAESI